jgi:ABC-2 type transport system ATP-binding protein
MRGAGEPGTAVQTAGLTRRYGDLVAVDGLDLDIRRGEIYGFLGLNGAGKTTTIRMLLGMIRPTSGVASLLGVPVRRGGRGPWDRIGYLVEAPGPCPSLTVLENLRAAARLRGIGDDAVIRAVERLGLASHASRRARDLSHGNLQRLGLALALFHEPELLILDEPANGLDPAGVVEVRQLLRSLATAGVTVLMSSHILAEVDRLATRIGVIHHGRLIEEIGPAELELRRNARLVVTTRDREAALRALRDAGYDAEPDGDGLVLRAPRAVQRPDDVAGLLVRDGHALTRLAVEQEDLEARFLRLTGGEEAA